MSVHTPGRRSATLSVRPPEPPTPRIETLRDRSWSSSSITQVVNARSHADRCSLARRRRPRSESTPSPAASPRGSSIGWRSARRARWKTGRSRSSVAAGAKRQLSSKHLALTASRYMARTAVSASLRPAFLPSCSGLTFVTILRRSSDLVAQFLSPLSNHRRPSSAFSLRPADPAHAYHLLRRLLTHIRSATSPAFTVGIKLGCGDFITGGLGPEEAMKQVKAAREMRVVVKRGGKESEEGYDFVEVSGGSYANPGASVADLPPSYVTADAPPSSLCVVGRSPGGLPGFHARPTRSLAALALARARPPLWLAPDSSITPVSSRLDRARSRLARLRSACRPPPLPAEHPPSRFTSDRRPRAPNRALRLLVSPRLARRTRQNCRRRRRHALVGLADGPDRPRPGRPAGDGRRRGRLGRVRLAEGARRAVVAGRPAPGSAALL
jgi:hypothetical protein